MEPYINVTPTPTSDPDSTPRVTYSTMFSRIYTSILTFLDAVEPNLQRHPYTNIIFGSRFSPYLPNDLFPPHYLHFNFFLKRWNLTSNVTPTPISSRTSDARIWHSWPLTTTQHHPYASEVQERVMPGCGIFGPLLLPLYLHFKLFLKRWCLTSNVTHKPPSDPDSPPRLTYPTIFSPHL